MVTFFETRAQLNISQIAEVEQQTLYGTLIQSNNTTLISMYEKSDKRRLYWLIDQYLSGKINESTFCDEFYYSYDLEINNETLSEIEQRTFAELSKVSSRFSQYEEDHKLDARAFSTEQELKQKIIKTKEKLKEQK